MRASWGFVLAAVVACGGGSNSDESTDESTDESADEATDESTDDLVPDAPAGFQELMSGSWELAAGEEAYFCVYATVPADLYVKGFRPIGPPGTHHTVMTLYTGSMPDGTRRCSVASNGTTMIYGSGVGAPDFKFPDGVGLHLPAGTRLLLNLHLYNAGDTPLTGTSGALYEEAQASEITNFAELVLAGPTLGLTVPTGLSTQTGHCRMSNVADEPVQVFALSQHMHKLGRHLKTVVEHQGGGETVLQDIPYDFEEQAFHLLDSHVQLLPTDTIRTECTYENNTGRTITFGESSDDEMCFSDLFYYPAQGASFTCSN